jgi:long-chain acyl-CoA synthetase
MKSRRERSPDLIPAAVAGTLHGLFRQRVLRTPELTAYRQFDAATGQWTGVTWREAAQRVDHWAATLAGLSLAPGERVAVQLRNCVEWVCYEQAALALGLVVVPLYPNDSPGNAAYVLGDSGSRVLLVGTLEQWLALASRRAQFPALQQVICLDQSVPARTAEGDLPVAGAADWLSCGGRSSKRASAWQRSWPRSCTPRARPAGPKG